MCFVMYYRFLSVKNHSLNTTFEYLFARKQENGAVTTKKSHNAKEMY